MTTLFNKIFTREYYRLNVGFFLVTGGIAFGFLRDVEHVALAKYFVSSVLFLSIPLSLWLAYSIKVILFNYQQSQKKENEFCLYASLFPWQKQWFAALTISFFELLPISAYGGFLSLICIQQKAVSILFYTAGSLTVLHVLIAIMLVGSVRRKNDHSPLALKLFLDKNIVKPYIIIPIEWLVRHQLTLFLTTKISGYGLLYIVSKLYENEIYDARLAGWAVTIVFTGHIILLYHFHHFENCYISWTRNLPRTFILRTLSTLGSLLLLCLPELALILTNLYGQLGITSVLSLIFLGVSLLIYFFGSLYVKDDKLENVLTKAFFMNILILILILYDVPLALLATALCSLGIYLWKKSYYNFECLEYQ